MQKKIIFVLTSAFLFILTAYLVLNSLDEYYYKKGRAFFIEGELEQAMGVFERGISLSLNPKYCLAGIGDIYYIKRDFEKAADFYSKALDINPEYVQVLNNLGMIYLKRGDTFIAKTYFRKAIACDEGYLSGYNNLFSLLMQEKDYGEAAKVVDTMQSLFPHMSATAINSALFHGARGEFDDAVKVLKEALKYNHDDPELYGHLGRLYDVQMGDTIEAQYYYGMFLKLVNSLDDRVEPVKKRLEFLANSKQ